MYLTCARFDFVIIDCGQVRFFAAATSFVKELTWVQNVNAKHPTDLILNRECGGRNDYVTFLPLALKNSTCKNIACLLKTVYHLKIAQAAVPLVVIIGQF